MRFEVVEQFSEGRAGDPGLSEDAIVVTDTHVAVLDGCTDKAGVPYFGMSSGRFAAQILAAELERLPAGVEFPDAVAHLTRRLDAAIHRALPMGEVLEDRPSASVAMYSAERREVWRLGDCHFAFDDTVFLGDKVIDQVTSHARAAYLQTLLAAGQDAAKLNDPDPGRELILPLLRTQHRLRNAEGSAYAYGAFDGLPVPGRFLQVTPVPEGVAHVILATDGYLVPALTLHDAEEHLRRSLAEDPLRVGTFASTKGVRPGAKSFDDRSYVRIAIGGGA